MNRTALRRTLITPIFVALAVPAFADDAGPTLQINTQSGDTLPGEPYRLLQRHPDGNSTRLQSGDIPDDGVIRLEGDWLDGGAKRVTVWVGKPSVVAGRFQYNPHETKNADYAVTVPPSAGDRAPDIAFTTLFDGKPAKLSDFRGEVVLLDFWASWCGPCQEPMAHNQALLEKHAGDWAGKARIVALSIDDDAETAREHVEKKGWTAMYHAFSSEGEPGWRSGAPTTYGVWSIPTVLLIDAEGEILWRGHPSRVDLEAMIEDAIQAGE